MANNNGSEIKYFYNIDADKAILISGLLSAFIKYTQYAFGIIPTRMVFGSTDLQDIRIFASADYNMAMNNPEQLLVDPKFKKTFGLLHQEDQNIVIPYIIPFLQREATKLLQKQITADFPKLLKLISDLRSERDSLTNIKGIGPSTLETLQSLGIRNISEFIKLDKDSLRKISEQSYKRNLISENKLLKWQNQGRRLMKSSKRLSL